MREQRRTNAGFWVTIGLLIFMLGLSGLMNLGLFGMVVGGRMRGPSTTYDRPVDAEPDLSEIWSYGYGETKVVRIPLTGVIMRGRQERMFGSEPDMVESILSQIRMATQDESVRAIILEVDSPGGAVTPSDEIYTALNRFKADDEGRVIVVFVRDLCASGGYYASMAGDLIVAEPTAIVGSVGVIMQTLNMKGLGEKLGMSSVTIASGANKDMLNPFEEVNPNHVNMLQRMVDEMQDRFASIVEDARGFEDRTLLDGRVFTAPSALENGFIDCIGYWDDAVGKTEELLGEEVKIVRYTKQQTFWDMLMSSKAPNFPGLTMHLMPLDAPKMLYLWRP
jgi:protease IV